MAILNILKKLNHRDTKFLPRFSKISKVIIFSVLAISTVFFVKNILAADNIIKQKQDAIQTGNNQESWINESMSSNLVSTQILLGGTIPDAVLNGETTPGGYPVSYLPGGVIGITNQLVASTFNSPASGVEYIAQVKDNFLGKPTYAADGVGFTGLSKLLPLWKVFRNMVYSISAIIFVIIGIMIMLRVKISPQAVISIQNSIPKIITTLILVTFSYAIAGLCIDLANFILAFFLSLLFSGKGIDHANNLFDLSWKDWTINNLVNLIRGWAGDSAFNFTNLNSTNFWTFQSMINRMIPNVALAAIGGIIGGIAGAILGSTIPGLGTIAGGAAGLGIGAILVLLIIEIILIISIIKFLFGLVKCYITLILKIVTGPLEISLGAFPNSKMGFSKWILDVIGNLAVFPISILFLVFVNILIDYVGRDGLWVPTLLQGTGSSAFAPTLVGIAAILMLPKLPSMIPEFIFQIKPSPWGKAIGEGLKTLPFIPTIQKGVSDRVGGDIGEKIKNERTAFNNWKAAQTNPKDDAAVSNNMTNHEHLNTKPTRKLPNDWTPPGTP